MLERARERIKYIRPLVLPFLIYLAVLYFSTFWVEAQPESPWRYIIADLPLFPAIVIALGVVRAIQQLDELERKILFDSMAISFILTLLLTLTLGMLESAGALKLNSAYIGLFMALVWAVAKLWLHRRYE